MKNVLLTAGIAGLLSLGAAFAQTTASHTVTAKVPVMLSLKIDTTDVLFDFTGTTTGTSDSLSRAGSASYVSFLEGASASQDFAPSTYTGAANDYVNARVVTNQSAWTLSVDSIGAFTGSLAGRLKIKVDGGAYAAAAAGVLKKVTTGSQSSTDVALRYALNLQKTDRFDGGTNQNVTVTYKVTAP